MKSAIAWEQYCAAREQLQTRLAEKIRRQMSTLVGDMASADILLVAADGKKLAAHECILRSRAPGFYQRHIEATINAMGPKQDGKLREVAIGDIDSAGLEFFIHSVYTEEEIALIPVEQPDTRQVSSRASNQSFAMDDSTTELDFQMGGADDRVEDDTPTMMTGRPPLANYSQQSGMMSYPNSPRKPAPIAQSMSSSAGPYPIMGGPFGHSIASSSAPSVPLMTSFRDLASGSPMNSSIYSLGGRSEVADIPEEDEDTEEKRPPTTPLDNRPMNKFIRFDSLSNGNDPQKEYLERKRSSGGSRQMFPMFIGLGDNSTELCEKSISDSWKGSNRLSLSKRMSMTSLTSLTSIDLTPCHDGQPPIGDISACSKLANDLMQMYVNSEDTDCIIRTEGGDIHAHKCILSATCPFFRQQLQKSKRVEMRGFSKNSINFLLLYLYGGVTSIPDDVDVWEVVSLATHLNHKDLAQIVILHIKATKFHWFHRPCASCVSAVFDCLSQLAQIRCLKPLYEEAMSWQAKHFARVWKGRVFLYLNEKWQKECYEGIIQHMDDETVIEVILSCERLQVALSRSKSDSAIAVLQLVDDILDVAMQFLLHSFHLVVTSKSFQSHGKGLALNLGLLEDLLPSLVHSLSADVAIKTYKGLASLLGEIQKTPPSPMRKLNIAIDDWSPRFAALIRRMVELCDRHLLHYAASVVRADAYSLLSDEQRQRIEETGIFVEIRQPKAPPPRLTSTSRSYKRSASVGVQNTSQNLHPRARSAERSHPLTSIQQPAEKYDNQNKNDEIGKKPMDDNDEKNENSKSSQPEVEKTRKLQSPQRRSRSRNSEKSQDKIVVEKKKTAAAAEPKTESKNPANVHRSRESVPRSPVKKKVIQDDIQMERQSTHTIITVDKIRAAQLPGPDSSPVKGSSEKPKSVVKPIMKDNPLASSANRTVIRDRVSSRKTAEPSKPSSSSTPKSAIPKSTNPRPRSDGSTSSLKTSSGRTTSARSTNSSTRPRSTITKKETNSIEK